MCWYDKQTKSRECHKANMSSQASQVTDRNQCSHQGARGLRKIARRIMPTELACIASPASAESFLNCATSAAGRNLYPWKYIPWRTKCSPGTRIRSSSKLNINEDVVRQGTEDLPYERETHWLRSMHQKPLRLLNFLEPQPT